MMRILYVFFALVIPTLLTAADSNHENPLADEVPFTPRAMLFRQIKEGLDNAYTLAIEAVNEELVDGQRDALHQQAGEHLEAAWQGVEEYNIESTATGLLEFPFSRMDLRIDTLAEAKSTRAMFILLMTSLASYQAEHL